MKNIRIRIKKWFFNAFLKRYLAGVDDSFINYFAFNFQKSFSAKDNTNKNYKRLIKELSSSKYKKYFYNAVNYTKPNKKRIMPYGKTFVDRLKSFIAKTYIFFYDRKLYRSIKTFKKWTSHIVSSDNAIDEYFAKTTYLERNDKRLEYGIINKINHDAIVRLGRIKTKRVLKITLID